MKWIHRHITFANVVSMMALVLALGGTSYAAVSLQKNSVGGKQLKKNSVTSSKVKNGSLLKKDFKKGQLPKGATGATGQTGPAGAPGTPGPAGTAAAFARVDSTGLLFGDADQSRGITAANIQHNPGAPGPTVTGNGVYCIGGLPFKPTSAMVAPDSAGDIDTQTIASVAIQRTEPAPVNLGNCDADHQQARISLTAVSDVTPPTLTEHRFFIWFEK